VIAAALLDQLQIGVIQKEDPIQILSTFVMSRGGAV
jgi:hypothetical protein